jgi:hypothetical protein
MKAKLFLCMAFAVSLSLVLLGISDSPSYADPFCRYKITEHACDRHSDGCTDTCVNGTNQGATWGTDTHDCAKDRAGKVSGYDPTSPLKEVTFGGLYKYVSQAATNVPCEDIWPCINVNVNLDHECVWFWPWGYSCWTSGFGNACYECGLGTKTTTKFEVSTLVLCPSEE